MSPGDSSIDRFRDLIGRTPRILRSRFGYLSDEVQMLCERCHC